MAVGSLAHRSNTLLNDKWTCLTTTGIISMSLGTLMMIWGMTSSRGNFVIASNPILIAGLLFFIFGFMLLLLILTRSCILPRVREMRGEDANENFSSRVQTYDDNPPTYSECFVIDMDMENCSVPAPSYVEYTMNDLPSYQEIMSMEKSHEMK